MITLGIDPGYTDLGYSIIKNNNNCIQVLSLGLIGNNLGNNRYNKYSLIYHEINKLIDQYKPNDLAIESLFFSNNKKTFSLISEVRGIILLACSLNNLKITEYTPTEIKKVITGYGKANKEQIKNALSIILKTDKLTNNKDDINDALAIGITHQLTNY